MTQPPGTLRPIPDPQAEMERLAEARKDPPGREWGVRHPTGYVTAGGTASRGEVARWCDAWNRDCPHCGPEPHRINGHTLAYRDPSPWRDDA